MFSHPPISKSDSIKQQIFIKCNKKLAKNHPLVYNTFAQNGDDNTASNYPGVAQLVARLIWDQEAAGSSPVTRTKKSLKSKDLGLFLYPKALILKTVFTDPTA